MVGKKNGKENGKEKLLISARSDQESRFVAGEGFEPPTSGVTVD